MKKKRKITFWEKVFCTLEFTSGMFLILMCILSLKMIIYYNALFYKMMLLALALIFCKEGLNITMEQLNKMFPK